MSVQVSYKKQFLVYVLLIFIAFSALEMISQVIAKPYVFDGCANRLEGNGIYPDTSKSDLIELCKNYYETNVYSSDDITTIIQFPDQYSKSVNINSLGLRGGEIEDKQSDVTRILMLGGSTTFGWYALDDNSTIPHYLQKKLNLGQEKFEVINAGHLSAASAFETKFLKENLNLEPDIVIVYDGYNEITTPFSIDTSESEMQLQIYLKYLDHIFYSPRLVDKILHEIESNILLQTQNKTNSFTLHYTDEDYVKTADRWEENWSKTCKDLKSEDLKIIIFLQPILGSDNKDLTDYETSIMYEEAFELVNNYYLLKEKIPKLKEHCTNVIDITDAFEDIDKPVFADRMHTGSYGNEIIADRIYEEMQSMLNK
jgi:hypothetical protein